MYTARMLDGKSQEHSVVSQNENVQPINEPILQENPTRWVMMPIKYPHIWNMFKRHEANFWTVEDFDLSAENRASTIREVKPIVLEVLKNLLIFNIISGKEIYGNACVRTCEFIQEIQIPEARAFYGFQCAFEAIHNDFFNQFFCFFFPKDDEQQQKSLIENIMNMNSVKKKKEWIMQYWNDKASFVVKIIIVCIIKTIFNTSNILMCKWLSNEGLCSNYCVAHEKVERDLDHHSDFCIMLYRDHILNKLQYEDMVHYICSAMAIELQFAEEFLPLTKMNITICDIWEYLQFEADDILKKLTGKKYFNKNFLSIPFMPQRYKDEQTFDYQKNECSTLINKANHLYGQKTFSIDHDF